jgi:hypothetical protein
MYGIPADLDLAFLIGSEVVQVCLGSNHHRRTATPLMTPSLGRSRPAARPTSRPVATAGARSAASNERRYPGIGCGANSLSSVTEVEDASSGSTVDGTRAGEAAGGPVGRPDPDPQPPAVISAASARMQVVGPPTFTDGLLPWASEGFAGRPKPLSSAWPASSRLDTGNLPTASRHSEPRTRQPAAAPMPQVQHLVTPSIFDRPSGAVAWSEPT